MFPKTGERAGGRRYYRPEDLDLLKKIHFLLYTKGYTIKGVQKLLSGAKSITAELVGISEHFDLKTEPSPAELAKQQEQEQSQSTQTSHQNQDTTATTTQENFDRANDELPFEFPEQPKQQASSSAHSQNQNEDLKKTVVAALKDVLVELKSLKEQLDTPS